MLKDLKVCNNIEQFEKILNPSDITEKITIYYDFPAKYLDKETVFTRIYESIIIKSIKLAKENKNNKKTEEADISDFDN